MVFKGTPGQRVLVTNPKIGEPRALRFDANGLYETNVRSMIRRMKRKFEAVEPATQPFHCKKCDFATDNRGLLMAHYREKHPKEQ